MSQQHSQDSSKESIQKLQRDERARFRETRRNVATYINPFYSPRVPPTSPSESTNLDSSLGQFQRLITSQLSLEGTPNELTEPRSQVGTSSGSGETPQINNQGTLNNGLRNVLR